MLHARGLMNRVSRLHDATFGGWCDIVSQASDCASIFYGRSDESSGLELLSCPSVVLA